MSFKFDPTTSISSEFGIFGIPCSEEQARVVLLPVPWEVTTSYGWGASQGPQLIRQASEQVDLFDLETKKAYEVGYFMRQIPQELKDKNDKFKSVAQNVIQLRSDLSTDEKKIAELCQKVNLACEEMTAWTLQQAEEILNSGKLLGLVGGDHSTPWGAIQAVSKKHQGEFAVLHFDAHADLRKSYQGFTQSHASIMYNVMNHSTRPKKLVQVGIRDFCEEEYELIQSRKDIKTFFDLDLKRRLLQGESWGKISEDILKELPDKVYISFDIDGLDPVFCPHTGTPVPGGLNFDQVFYLFRAIAESGRKIVGFDLNEVSTGGVPTSEADEWDGNVGARILYKLCGWSTLTNP
ncbi:MAG: agmatinase family protein [Bdellovibrionota bacterium]